MKRRTFDTILSITGFALAAVLLAAGALLNWGANFASSSVRDQLVAQKISFGAAETFNSDCLKPLASWAGKAVDSGAGAEAYASLIKCHMETALTSAGLKADETYSTVSAQIMEKSPMVAIMAEDTAADKDAKAKAQAEIDTLTNMKELLYQGESLRSILLTAYAFGTIGTVASIASLGAYGLSALMFILSILGWMHLRRTPENEEI